MTLKDICELIVDCPHVTDNDEGFGYPLIRTPNVGKGMLLLENVHRVSKDVYDRRNRRAKPQTGDLILAREAPAGNVALIRESQEVCLGQRTVLIRPNKNLVVPEFLTYYLLAPYNQHRIKQSANGSTVEHVNMPSIRGLEIELPTLHVQKEIASILSNYDTLIDINTKRIKILEESARELYKEWFVRMRFPGYEQTKFVKGIPEGWKYMRIDENYKTGSGGTPSSSHNEYYNEGTINWIRTGELKDGFIFKSEIQITDKGLNNSSAKMYPPYSVIIAMYGNSIGQLGILSNPSSTNQACCVIQPKTIEYSWEFIYLSLIEYRQYLISFGFGAAQQNISQDEIKKFKIVFPKKEIAQSFTYMVHPLFKEIETLQLQNQTLASTRDRLLPRLLSGELKVKA